MLFEQSKKSPSRKEVEVGKWNVVVFTYIKERERERERERVREGRLFCPFHALFFLVCLFGSVCKHEDQKENLHNVCEGKRRLRREM
jgi:hypothetical protein